MNTKHIRSWRATAAINSDDTELALQYTDGSQTLSKNLPPARLAALITVLESSQAAAVILDAKGQPWITNAANAPG
jgi:hypothetical protein